MYMFVFIVYSFLYFFRVINGFDCVIYKIKIIIQGGIFCKYCICIDLKISRIKKVVIVFGYFMVMKVVDEVNYCVIDYVYYRNRVVKMGN